jgi:hypothetical protein
LEDAPLQILLQLLTYSKKHAPTINIVLLGVIASGAIAGGIHVRNLSTIVAEKNTLLAQSAAIAGQRDALERQRLIAVEATWQARVDDAVAAAATLKREIDSIRADAKRRQTEVKALQEIFERHLATDEEIVEKAGELLPLLETPPSASKQTLATATQLRTSRIERINAVYGGIVSRLADNGIRTREDQLRSEAWIKWSDERLTQMHESLTAGHEYPSAVTMSSGPTALAPDTAASRRTDARSLLLGALALSLTAILLFVTRRRRRMFQSSQT